MSTTYNFAYSITKNHPYATEGFSPEEAFEALRRAGATMPVAMFNMGESGIVYKESAGKYGGNSYWINLQE
jgi:hypothetical protein